MTIPPTVMASAHSTAPAQLYLQVSINGNRVPELQPFTQRADGLWASPDVLHAIGFRNAGEGRALTRLASIADTRVEYDAGHQTVAITAPLSSLDLSPTILTAAGLARPPISVGAGMLLNYDLYSTYDPRGATTLSSATELRAFSSLGMLSNTMLSTFGMNSNAAFGATGRTRNVRLDTMWTRSWPDKEISLMMGDTTTSYLSWTRATRIGGIRLGRNFALQPYKTTSPLPAFMGSATLPSSVDLYIDGIKRYNGNLPAGPFQLDGIPTVSGLGNAQVVLTDALGRRTQINIPFYASSRLLAKGLSDWSIEAGYVRKDYGLSSFSYAADPVYSGTLRYGVSNSLTVETHAESASGAGAAGVGAVATLGAAGQVSGSYALSQSGSLRGSQYGLGYQWQNRNFNFGMNTIRSDSAYRDVASANGSLPPARISESAFAGVNLRQLGTLNLSYVRTRYGSDQSNRYAGVYWSKSLGNRATLSASYNRNLNVPHDQTVFIGLSIFLDHNLSVSGSVQHANHETGYGVTARQTASGNTGWSWSAQSQQSPGGKYGYAEADYRGQYGEYRAGVITSNAHSSAYAGASGSVVLMGGGVFAGRKIYDGFAVVSTDHIPDVPVKLQNNPMGKTDSNGMLMISPLNAYQKNLIAIDPMDLPMNMKIDRVDAEVATQAGSGALVTFKIHPVRAATVILHDRAGQPLPVGMTVRLNGGASSGLIGYDGMTYLEGLQDHNSLQADVSGKICSAVFDYRRPANIAAPVGPLRCE